MASGTRTGLNQQQIDRELDVIRLYDEVLIEVMDVLSMMDLSGDNADLREWIMRHLEMLVKA